MCGHATCFPIHSDSEATDVPWYSLQLTEMDGCYIKTHKLVTPESEVDYKALIPDANLRRRMDRLLKMSVSAGLECIKDIPAGEIGGIVTATDLGFIDTTIKFADNLLDNSEQMLNPTPFMQSTFNTAAGYIALIRKIHAYNMTYVQSVSGLASCLNDVMMLLGEGARHVLAGAFEDSSETVSAIRRRFAGDDSVKFAGGAGFMLLSSVRDGAEGKILKYGRSACIEDDGQDRTLLLSEMCKSDGSSPVALVWAVCSVLDSDGKGTYMLVDDINKVEGEMFYILIRKY